MEKKKCFPGYRIVRVGEGVCEWVGERDGHESGFWGSVVSALRGRWVSGECVGVGWVKVVLIFRSQWYVGVCLFGSPAELTVVIPKPFPCVLHNTIYNLHPGWYSTLLVTYPIIRGQNAAGWLHDLRGYLANKTAVSRQINWNPASFAVITRQPRIPTASLRFLFWIFSTLSHS
jgi:hypothetical protein